MKILRSVLLVALFGFILYVKFVSLSSQTGNIAPVSADRPGISLPADRSVPAKALEVLQVVRSTGEPPAGYVGGRVFQNREGRLPPDGDYREFDVDPHHGQRNAERLIVEWNSKKAWYTGDHYQTFIPLP